MKNLDKIVTRKLTSKPASEVAADPAPDPVVFDRPKSA